MIAPRRYLQELVLDPVAATIDDELSRYDVFLPRVSRAVRAAYGSESSVGSGDLAALVRQAVLRCHLVHGEPCNLRVPRRTPWPDRFTWEEHGCTATPAGPSYLHLDVHPWTPTWVDEGARKVVEDAVQEAPRRQRYTIAADPLIEAWTGFRTYIGDGQRAAIRAAFLMPPGDTVVVELPTGGGKTLAFQLLARVFGRTGGLVFVVTPTVALARDQEERFLSLIRESGPNEALPTTPLAFHSGLSDDARQAVASGIAGDRGSALPIAFASPEAAVGALRWALFRAASAGRLRLFAVDEAHIVNQWGNLFRPEFQSLAGLRNALLDVCPRSEDRFGTMLFTATLTHEGFDILQQSFGATKEQVVAEPALRPEPGFLISTPDNENERQRYVLEAIRFLPRPLILYTTLREDAERWYRCLRDERLAAPLRRIRLIRGGDLSGPAGEMLLDEWRRGEVDVVVATSAFGLGVDQSNVRSIVHACLPESIDRYYQEVGRAGRDGSASVALLISTPADVHTAARLAGRQITVERGFERWEMMRHGSERAGGDVIRVSLDALPADLHEHSELGAKWNLRTLVLMARAGLISFVATPPPEVKREDVETELEFEKRRREVVERSFRSITLRIIDGRHADRKYWDDVVTPKRHLLHANDERALALVCELRNLRRPLNDIFREVYTLHDLGIEPPRFLGSCPVTRAQGRVDFFQARPTVRDLTETRVTVARRFDEATRMRRDAARRLWVAYTSPPDGHRESENIRRKIVELLRYAVSDGVVEIDVSEGILERRNWDDLLARSPYRFLVRNPVRGSENGQTMLSLPCVTVLSRADARVDVISTVARRPCILQVIVLPRDIPDLVRSDRFFFDVRDHQELDDLIRRLARWVY